MRGKRSGSLMSVFSPVILSVWFRYSRVPTLEFALAYEAIYGKPIRELFAGLYEQIAPEVSARAKILSYRKNGSPDPKRLQVLSELALRHKN
jgi:hypothetical protein